LILSAASNADRGPLAVEALQAGKHVLVDKPALTRLADLDAVESAAAFSGKRWSVCFSERLGNPLHERLRALLQAGRLGRPVSSAGFGPHRLLPPTRPAWMFQPEQYGGVINDIGSHQIELFRWLTGERIVDFRSRTGNFGTAQYPDFEDYGDVWFQGERGTAGYAQVHWFTPRASPTWGDVRQFVVGTEGTIEVRSNANLAGADARPMMLLTTHTAPPERYVSPGRHHFWARELAASLEGGSNGTLTQQETFESVRTILRMQAAAERIEPDSPSSKG